jgi:Erv1 / Alr family
MATIITAGFKGQPHAHLTGRPGAGKAGDTPSTETVQASAPPPIDGSPLWAALHRRALVWQGGEDSIWLAQFRRRVPCGQCKQHWDAMLARTPPDWANYFAWTVARHNEVNARLGKPGMEEAEARVRWVVS